MMIAGTSADAQCLPGTSPSFERIDQLPLLLSSHRSGATTRRGIPSGASVRMYETPVHTTTIIAEP